MLASRLPPGMDQVLVVVLIMLVMALFLEWLRRRFLTRDGVLHQALQHLDRGTLLVDGNGRITFWSSWLEQVLKIPAALALNCTMAELQKFVPDQPFLGNLENLMKEARGDGLSAGRLPLKTGSGQEGVVLCFLQKVAGEASGWVIAIHWEAQLLPVRDLLAQAFSRVMGESGGTSELEQLKSEFLAICSHELKTPLVSISGYLDLMNTEKLGPLTEKQKNALAVSLRNSSRLNALLTSLLDFARMEAGKLHFEFAPQRLLNLLEEVQGVVHPMAASRNISLRVNASPELHLATVDGALVHRAILNLADNAIKFTAPGGSVTLSAWEEDDQIWVEVADTGIGIPPDKIEKIREPFFQVDSSDTRRTGGIGLGLAIVEKILKGHGTRLTILSQPDTGTRMRFPLKKAHQSPSGRWQAFQRPVDHSSDSSGGASSR